MTPNEFTAWLDGFLDGKDSLNADQIATLRAKAEKLTPLKGLDLGRLSGVALPARPDMSPGFAGTVAMPQIQAAYSMAEN